MSSAPYAQQHEHKHGHKREHQPDHEHERKAKSSTLRPGCLTGLARALRQAKGVEATWSDTHEHPHRIPP